MKTEDVIYDEFIGRFLGVLESRAEEIDDIGKFDAQDEIELDAISRLHDDLVYIRTYGPNY